MTRASVTSFMNSFGRRLGLPIRSRGQREAVVFHALHKSASTFLFKFFDDLYRRLDKPLFSVHNDPPDEQNATANESSCFGLGPVRSFDVDRFHFSDRITKHIVQVRDPRDILVSEYYSLGWRHSDSNWTASDRERREKIRSISIDEYVLQQEQYNKYPLLNRYLPIFDIATRANVRVVKYEDMVCRFDQWVWDVIQFLELPSPKAWRRRLVRKYRNEFVQDEKPDGHKRKITPGDHLEKLKPDTIVELNEKYRAILEFLGYK